ncbi:MAG: hypothetical protein AAF409_09245 [Pseudomonadota bacterium]
MSLSNAFTGLKNGLKDLGSLEVRTFTGEIDMLINVPAGDDTAFAKAFDKAKTTGDLKLRIYTRLDADGDSEHYVSDSGVDEGMATSHVAAFQMGQEIRRSYLELFRETAERIIT